MLLSISIDPEPEKQDPSYRILMPVRQCTRWFVQHMLPHWLFITAACYEKRLHPSPTSNEFLHAELNSGSRHLVRAVSEKDKDWAAIIAYYVTALQAWREMRLMLGGGWEEKTGFWAWGLAAFGAVRDFSLKLPPQPCGAHGGSMIKLFHMVAQTNVLLLKCRQRSWCELCMYTNELCCCMLLWWLPSLLGIDPSGVKTGRKKGRKEGEGRPAAATEQRGTPPSLHTKFKVFSVMFLENPMDLNLNYINVFFSLFLGIIHSCFAIGSFGCCLYVGSQRWVMSWQLMITKQSPGSWVPGPRTWHTAKCVLTKLMKPCQATLTCWSWLLNLL